MRILVLLCLAACASAARPSAPLHERVAAMARAHRGQIAVFARHAPSGRTIEVAADREIKTASAIKLAILLEAFYQVRDGTRSLDERIALRTADKVLGSGVLHFLHDGLELTLEDALVLMTIASDNTATNLVIERLGGVGPVNRRLAALGLSHTHLYKKIGVPATEPMPADQKQFGLGKSTARELVQLMEHVAQCTLGAPPLCRRMLEMLRNQQSRHYVARFLETIDATEVPSAIAAKLGELNAARIEVALVDSRTGPIAIAVATWDNADERWSADNEAGLAIARISEAIVRAWSPDGVRAPPP